MDGTSPLRAIRSILRNLRRDDGAADRGATMVLMTLSMVALFVFAAFAVDLSSAWSQRRQNQGTVDSAGIAGALMTRGLDQAPAIAAAEDEIMRISYESLALAGTKTFAAWQADWAACADPAKGAEFTVTSYSDCISFTGSLSKMRFQLPEVDSAAPFARVIGVNNLQTDAAVEVIITLQARGNVLPFGLPGSAADETEICLKTGANPKNVPPCDGPDTGNFQFLDISEYGNEEMNTSTVCSGQTNTRMARNIARGVDHPILEAANNGLAFRVDITGCTQGNINYGPYSLTTEPGNKVGVLDNGFIDGVSGLPGRFSLSSDTVLLGGKTIDDRPLWEYLNAAGQALCGAVSDHDAMAACLASWNSGNGMIFDDSLADSPRFGWVPLFWNAGLGAGSTTNNIQEFRPIFIQTTLWSCNANACSAEHDPGELLVGSIAANNKLEAVTALQIPEGALPEVISDGFFGEGSETLYAISR